MENKKSIILCQGDKKELEEITGQKYVYLVDGGICGNPRRTFIEASSTRGIDLESRMIRMARISNADAIIHYSDSQYVEGKYTYWYARGTPVKLKKK